MWSIYGSNKRDINNLNMFGMYSQILVEFKFNFKFFTGLSNFLQFIIDICIIKVYFIIILCNLNFDFSKIILFNHSELFCSLHSMG